MNAALAQATPMARQPAPAAFLASTVRSRQRPSATVSKDTAFPACACEQASRRRGLPA